MPSLNPWPILAAILLIIAASMGGFFYGRHVENLAWEASTNALKTQAERELATANAAAAAADLRAAQLNTQLEADHAVRVQSETVAQGRIADLAGQLDRLRQQPGRGAGCGRPMPVPGQPATVSPGPAAGNPTGPSGSFRELAEIAADAVRLAEAGKTCRDWAVEQGGAQ